MNIELLIKLVKLANHNPNDNEANSAARRVCKLIEEGKFKFTNTVIEPPKQPIQNPVQNPSPYRTPADILNDLFNRQQKAYQQYADTVFNSPYVYSRTSQPKPKTELKCTQCGIMVKTGFIGVPATFICGNCTWDNYMKSTSKM